MPIPHLRASEARAWREREKGRRKRRLAQQRGVSCEQRAKSAIINGHGVHCITSGQRFSTADLFGSKGSFETRVRFLAAPARVCVTPGTNPARPLWTCIGDCHLLHLGFRLIRSEFLFSRAWHFSSPTWPMSATPMALPLRFLAVPLER